MGDEEIEAPTRNNGATTVMRRMREEEDQDLKALVDALGADQDYEVKLYRKSPKEVRHAGERISIEGLIETYSELPTEQQVEDTYGGGTYLLKVMKSNGQYFKSKTFKIAGRPRIEPYIGYETTATAPVVASAPAEDSALASQAMRTLKDLVDKGGQQNGMNVELINTMMAPLMAQVQSASVANLELQKQLAEKDSRMLELITAKPDTSKEDGILREVWNSDSRRLESIREAHQSEMRIMREHHEAALTRLDDRNKDTLKSAERSHEREIDSMREIHKQALESLKDSKDNRIDSLKSDIARLERELSEARSETGALRAIKEKGLVEQATELAQVGDALKAIGIGGGGEDEDNRKWYEKAISAAVENPEAIAQIIGGANAGPPQPQPQQMQPPQQQQMVVQQQGPPPIGQPFQGPDGQAYVRIDEQTVVPLEQAQQILTEKKAAAEQAARMPNEIEVSAAISFIESAFSNGTPAETFANTAKASIPQDILAYIEEQGVENFLNNVAKLDKHSPLRNVAGRKYMREVGNFLLKGEAE